MSEPEIPASALKSDIRKIGNVLHETVRSNLVDILKEQSMRDHLDTQIPDSPHDVDLRFKRIVDRLDAGRNKR